MNRDYTYIITGVTGYVGNVFAKKLLDEGCNVVGLARSKEKVQRVFTGKCPDIIYGDIRNKDDIRKLFAGDKPKIVIHTVAYVSIGEGDMEELYDVTVTGTENILDVAREHNTVKFLHISSSEAIPHGVKLNKELSNYIPDPANTRKGYNRAKSMADVVVLKAVEKYNLDASLILLAGILGPGDYSYTHMTQVIIDYINGKLPASVNGGYNDFDIRDVADVLCQIIDRSKKGESYIFANKPDKINEVIKYVADMTGRKMLPTLPIWVAYVGLPFLYIWSKITGKRPLYTLSSLASLRADTNFPLDKVTHEFGYQPRSLKETVTDHVRFLVDNGMVQL